MFGVRDSLRPLSDVPPVTSVRSKPSSDARRHPVHVTIFASSVLTFVRSLTACSCPDSPIAKQTARTPALNIRPMPHLVPPCGILMRACTRRADIVEFVVARLFPYRSDTHSSLELDQGIARSTTGHSGRSISASLLPLNAHQHPPPRDATEVRVHWLGPRRVR